MFASVGTCVPAGCSPVISYTGPMITAVTEHLPSMQSQGDNIATSSANDPTASMLQFTINRNVEVPPNIIPPRRLAGAGEVDRGARMPPTDNEGTLAHSSLAAPRKLYLLM